LRIAIPLSALLMLLGVLGAIPAPDRDEIHYYPDEGHGFAKRENQIDALRRTIAWFERYLR